MPKNVVSEAVETIKEVIDSECGTAVMSQEQYLEVLEELRDDIRERITLVKSELEG